MFIVDYPLLLLHLRDYDYSMSHPFLCNGLVCLANYTCINHVLVSWQFLLCVCVLVSLWLVTTL